MNPEINAILNKLEDNGYKAYIVGGYVRDKLLGIESTDVDISTNAKPKEIKDVLNINSDISIYGSYKIITDHYNFDITTFRKELSYNGRKPDEIEYINNIEEDLNRRDFTINTICMDSTGKIIDLLNGMNDLNNKVIKMVGDANNKIKEDPLRILRALRFSIVLDFKLDNKLKNSIIKNKELIKTISYDRRREELNRILVSVNAIYGLDMLKKMDILKYLEINYKDIVYVDNLYGMYAQLEVSDNYNFSNNEKDDIKNIKAIINKKKINNEILFKYGLYISGVAGKILGYDQKEITKMYDSLPIKDTKDLKIDGEDIIMVLNIKPSSIVKKIYNDLINKVLNGNLENEKDDLICYVVNNKGKWVNE